MIKQKLLTAHTLVSGTIIMRKSKQMTKNTVIKTFIDVPVLLQTTLTFAMDILGGIKVPRRCDMPREKLDCGDGMILKITKFATP